MNHHVSIGGGHHARRFHWKSFLLCGAFGGLGACGLEMPAYAQGISTAPAARDGGLLPSITVNPPQVAPQRAAGRATQTRTRTSRSQAARAPAPASVSQEYIERANGPVRGYIAKRSATGTKTDTPLIETPQSISVVTREQIDAQAAKNLGESLRYTAGVVSEFRGAASGNFDQIVVRGYTADRYWDGLKIPAIGNYGTPNPDLYLMERVEVLKGPASVLFGQASPGGVVNMVSKRPLPIPFHELRFDADSNGRVFGAFDVGGPIDAKNQWLYRVTGLGLGGGTQVDYTKEGRFAIAPSVTWQPTANTSLTVFTSYQHDPEFGYYDVIPAIGSAVPNPRGTIPKGFYAGEPNFDKFDRKYFATGYQFEHRFSDVLTVRQNLRYVRGEFDWTAVQFNSLAANNFTVNRYSLRNKTEGDGLSLDNQAEANFYTGPFKHRALFGIDYVMSDADNRMWTGTAPPINLFNPVYGGTPVLPVNPQTNTNQVTDQAGIYAQDQVRVGNLLGLVGVRHDQADSRTKNFNTNAVTNQSDGAFTWRSGLLYLFDNGVAPYVSYSESFQPTAGTDYFVQPFKPRTGKQYEVGVKYQPVWINGLFTLAAFDTTENNRTTLDLAHTCATLGNAPGCGNFNIQIGEVRTRGFEAEAKVSVTRELVVLAAYTYLDARIVRSNNGDVGKRLTNSPYNMASAWFDYTFRSGELDGFGFGGGVRFVGASPANTLNTVNYFEAPAYTLFDAAMHYDFGAKIPSLKGLGVRLNVRNLTDQAYAASCGGSSLQAGYCFNGLRRTYTASMVYRW